MKKSVLFFFLLFTGITSFGQQFPLNFYICFDNGHISTQVRIPSDTIYFSDSNWVYIDTVHYHQNQWQIGRPQKTVFDSAFSYPNAIVTDTFNSCNPNDTSVFILKMPKHAWEGLGVFSFNYALDIDSGDIAKIEVSWDGGLSWSNILNDTTGYFSFGYKVAKPDLTKSTSGWKSINIYPIYYGLIETSPDSFLFRFTFMADSSTKPRDGWMIDNILMAYAGEGVEPTNSTKPSIELYPNPPLSFLTISAIDEIRNITIANALGQTVYSNCYHNNSVRVDVSDLPTGQYLVKINGTEVRKFVKQ